MSALKSYLLEVGLKKLVPAFIKGALAASLAFLAAHANQLQTWGITSGTWPLIWAPGQAPTGHVILIELDTLSASAIVLLPGLAISILALIQHHAAATIKGQPQDGEHQRATDPPKAA